nr:FAD-dependent oxidoreductase [Nocardioidaceae bacterium]
YAVDTSQWELVATYRIPLALPAMLPPLRLRKPVRLAGTLFVAGDHRDTASIQGAIVSGRRAAASVLQTLGLSPGDTGAARVVD